MVYILHIIYIYIYLTIIIHYTHAGILESPKSKNITLGEPVTLICIATGLDIEWRTTPTLNITQMKKNTAVLNETNSLLNGTLELVGSSYTDNITVWCIVSGSSGQGIDKSEKAYIFIQGNSFVML